MVMYIYEKKKKNMDSKTRLFCYRGQRHEKKKRQNLETPKTPAGQ